MLVEKRKEMTFGKSCGLNNDAFMLPCGLNSVA